MGGRLALLALSVICEFIQAVVDNANNTSDPVCPKISSIEWYDNAGKKGMRPI